MNNRFSSAGFSMVELLIAITLGVVLLLGVTQVYQGYKQSYNQQEGMAELQETARFSMQFLTRTIRQAGYREDVRGPASDVYKLDTAPDPDIDTRAIIGTNNDGENNSDTITVRFKGGSLEDLDASDDDDAGPDPDDDDDNDAEWEKAPILDCLGQPVNKPGTSTANRIAINRFFVESGALKCQRRLDNDPYGTPATFDLNETQPLLNGVTDMQILYGIDNTPGDGVMRVNRYLAANEIDDADNTKPNWNAVVSVQIVLSVQSIEQFTKSDGSRSPITREIKTVINLRNRLS